MLKIEQIFLKLDRFLICIAITTILNKTAVFSKDNVTCVLLFGSLIMTMLMFLDIHLLYFNFKKVLQIIMVTSCIRSIAQLEIGTSSHIIALFVYLNLTLILSYQFH